MIELFLALFYVCFKITVKVIEWFILALAWILAKLFCAFENWAARRLERTEGDPQEETETHQQEPFRSARR